MVHCGPIEPSHPAPGRAVGASSACIPMMWMALRNAAKRWQHPRRCSVCSGRSSRGLWSDTAAYRSVCNLGVNSLNWEFSWMKLEPNPTEWICMVQWCHLPCSFWWITPLMGPNVWSYYIMVIYGLNCFFGVFTGSAFLLLELVVQTKRMIIKKTMRKYEETWSKVRSEQYSIRLDCCHKIGSWYQPLTTMDFFAH